MMTLLGSLLGFIGALVPELLKYDKDRGDRQHELEVLSLQIAREEKGYQAWLEEIGNTAFAEGMKALYQTYTVGVRWVDALNGTVRPVLAYGFFLLYAAVKYAQYLQGVLRWTEEDQAIFAAIISFYYGQRALRKG